MQHSVRLSDAARAIYDACFTLAPISYEEAERRGTLHYRRAIDAAERVYAAFGAAEQMAIP